MKTLEELEAFVAEEATKEGLTAVAEVLAQRERFCLVRRRLGTKFGQAERPQEEPS